MVEVQFTLHYNIVVDDAISMNNFSFRTQDMFPISPQQPAIRLQVNLPLLPPELENRLIVVQPTRRL